MADPLRTITAVRLGSNWNCPLLRIVLQDALSEVAKVCPLVKLKIIVDGELLQALPKVVCRLKDEVPRAKLKLSLTGG